MNANKTLIILDSSRSRIPAIHIIIFEITLLVFTILKPIRKLKE